MSSNGNWKKHLAMGATYARMAFAPVIMAVLFTDYSWKGVAAAILFILASLTDWLDGYFARKYQSESSMGKFMDPIADKILVLAALIMLLYMQRVGPVMVTVLLTRDIFIGGLRSVAAANSVIIAAKPFGKWKTGLQMVAVPCIFVYEPTLGLPVYEIGYYMLWISVGLSVISAVQYTYGYYKGRI